MPTWRSCTAGWSGKAPGQVRRLGRRGVRRAKEESVVSWRAFAKCAGDDPAKYLVANLPRGRKHEAAQALCEGCPVRSECLRDALIPIEVSRILGVLEGENKSPDVIGQSHVVRGGVPLGIGRQRYWRPHRGVVSGPEAHTDSSTARRCIDCHRPMLHRDEPPKPGWVREGPGGRCGYHYRAHRRRHGETPKTEHTHCTKCRREFGAKGRLGGVVRVGRASTGTCRSCLWVERDARRRGRSRES
ncbi:WhiB family transcriptional regulator [Nocardia sp. NBC_01499]|uniref:WhiB family transcriptional regulator n=1 Tax=Nocardia sp. NBC_01499 TaxID=2903597 RepID=UPI00386B2F03